MAQPHVDLAMPHSDTSLALPVVRKIGLNDLGDALTKGMDDFSAFPTHVLFLSVIYPVIGVVGARLAANYDLLPLLFPLAAGIALLGPVAALGLYELSRQRELGLDVTWKDAFDVWRSLSLDSIVAFGALLLVIVALWLAIARAIYVANFGDAPTQSIPSFLQQIFATRAGWTLIVIGNGVGLLFAVAVLMVGIVSVPLLLDRDVSAVVAIRTSMRAVLKNPAPLAIWGCIVATLLVLGTLPLFIGLPVILPVLGHSNWHLYRGLVEPDPHGWPAT